MSKSIELFGLTFKPTTHCIISPIDANEEHDKAAQLLIDHIAKIADRIFHPVKDVLWLRNVAFHEGFNATQSRIPIVVGFSEIIYKHFNLPTENKGGVQPNTITIKSQGPALFINVGNNVPITAAIQVFIERHLTGSTNDTFVIGELDETIAYNP